MVTHNLAEALMLSDRIVVLSAGRPMCSAASMFGCRASIATRQVMSDLARAFHEKFPAQA